MPSAGDVERFGYCAHNWWLAKQGAEGGHGHGVEDHDAMGREQAAVESEKKEAQEWMRWSFRVLAVAASIAFLALELVFLQGTIELDWAFLLTAIIAVSMSSGLLVIAIVNERRAIAHARAANLVPGELMDTDLGGHGDLLEDPEWGLTGRPDYTIKTDHGIVPVEVKSSRTPERPHESHVLQLSCYLRLIEASTGKPPQYGLITYPEGTFRVEWDRDVQRYLKGTLARMAEAEAVGKADRDHTHAGRCKGCARRDACEQALA